MDVGVDVGVGVGVNLQPDARVEAALDVIELLLGEVDERLYCTRLRHREHRARLRRADYGRNTRRLEPR